MRQGLLGALRACALCALTALCMARQKGACKPLFFMPAGEGSITARNSFSSGRHLRHLAGFPGQAGLAAGAVGRVLPGAHLLAEFVVEHLRAGPDLHGAAPVADFKDELPAQRKRRVRVAGDGLAQAAVFAHGAREQR